jgi:hypothetical protein
MHENGKKVFSNKNAKHLPTGKEILKEKDEKLLKEIKRIKRLQKGLYKEYGIEEISED